MVVRAHRVLQSTAALPRALRACDRARDGTNSRDAASLPHRPARHHLLVALHLARAACAAGASSGAGRAALPACARGSATRAMASSTSASPPSGTRCARRTVTPRRTSRRRRRNGRPLRPGVARRAPAGRGREPRRRTPAPGTCSRTRTAASTSRASTTPRLGRSGERRRAPSSTRPAPASTRSRSVPGGRLVVTRYGAPGGSDGSVVVLDPGRRDRGGAPARARAGCARGGQERRLRRGTRRGLGEHGRAPARRLAPRFDARVLDLASGRELARFSEPELHFPRFGADGRAWFAWLDGARLLAARTERGDRPGPGVGREILLDDVLRHRARFRTGRARSARRPRRRDALERHRARRLEPDGRVRDRALCRAPTTASTTRPSRRVIASARPTARE